MITISSPAFARVRLENICTIYGQREIKLVGVGLVVGLDGTGDGGKNLPAMRALAQVMKLMNLPVTDVRELADAKNVAVVHIEATIPRSGLRYGQKIDCYVSSAMGAKSLRGGRLLASPIEEADIQNDFVAGLASGGIRIEDPKSLRTGKIPGGIVLHRNYPARFIDRKKGNLITLLLNESHASFFTASEVARVVNEEFSFESGKAKIAQAIGPGVIQVQLPQSYEKNPVDFVATMLNIGIEQPHTQARVVVNAKTGTVIISGEVELSPALISHKGLRIQIGAPAGGATQSAGGFARIQDRTNPESSQQLKQLVDALSELRLPTSDIIEIIRELRASGKLHAEYIER
ncbi:MAG: flagellar basal body P-ring protein FlgI [Planctomycetaceae bacterium]